MQTEAASFQQKKLFAGLWIFITERSVRHFLLISASEHWIWHHIRCWMVRSPEKLPMHTKTHRLRDGREKLALKSNEKAHKWERWRPSPHDTGADVLLVFRYLYVTGITIFLWGPWGSVDWSTSVGLPWTFHLCDTPQNNPDLTVQPQHTPHLWSSRTSPRLEFW